MKKIYTIGHSTRPIEEFIELLQHYKIQTLVDIRKIPKSRYNPQFGQDALKHYLEQNGIVYLHMDGLTGMRKPKKDSINKAWKHPGFRGYADYMQTEEFKKALEKLMEIAGKSVTTVMCAESVPWRCHRNVLADTLTVNGWNVIDIISKSSFKKHELPDFAVVEGNNITYPAKQTEMF